MGNFGDRDGKIYDRVEDISLERQRGYAWKGTFNVARAITHYEQAKQQGRAAFLIERTRRPSSAATRRRRWNQGCAPSSPRSMRKCDG